MKKYPDHQAVKIIPVLLLLIFLGSSVSAADHSVALSGGEFSSIQAAINAASAGDTIIVRSGIYSENVRIEKTLLIRGLDSGGGLPVIEPKKKGNAVEITANGCTFSGFIVQNAELLSGIRIISDRTTITDNTVHNCGQGIFLASANNNLISGNNITQNTRTGITLEGSMNNRIENNVITKNAVGIALDVSSSSNAIFLNDFDNTMNVLSKSMTTVWNSGADLSYRYLGKDRVSRMGNFWADYRGRDLNGDGIGDSPYVVQMGANRKAVLVGNQNVVDAYPLINMAGYYSEISTEPVPSRARTIQPITTPAGSTIPQTAAIPASSTSPQTALSRTTGAFSPFGAAALVFGFVAVIAGIILSFLRKHDLAESCDQENDMYLKYSVPVAAVYGILGSAFALISISFMMTLVAIPPANPVITGAWLLCSICVYFCISSLVLAYGALRSESYPSISMPHGVLTALAVPVVGLFMIAAPERREHVLFFFIVVLSISAAITFWYSRRRANAGIQKPAQPKMKTASTVTTPVPLPIVTSATPPDHVQGFAPLAGHASNFPKELENKYYNISLIGRGGIAWVYAANRKSDGKKVAVKIPISFDELTGKSFLNEIKVWETLRHPNIVEVSAVNILPVPYVEMEYVDGSLEQIAKPVPIRKAVSVVVRIADALRYAHSLGIIHRDIKPHNILVTGDLTPKINDWGMSKVRAPDLKKSSIAGFSPSYAAPEQISPAEYGKTSACTDIYQLGALFYELVTGSVPFGGESIVEVGNAILHDLPVPPSEYNKEAASVETIILRCLEKDPARRYQSADELMDVLARYLEGHRDNA